MVWYRRQQCRLAISWISSALTFLLMANSASGWQASDTGGPQSRATQFRSPLLEGLRNTVEESELIQKSGADSSLLDQLQQADQILADAKARNRYTLKLISRQSRVGIAATSPNIVLLTVDRLAAGDPGCCGQKTIQTPAIDQLARQGLRFTQWNSGSAESMPARWSLLIGQMLHRLPPKGPDRFHVKDEDITLAESLWKAGYLTAYFGLWRNGDSPQAHGYENWSGFLDGTSACEEYPDAIHVDGARVRIVENADGGNRVSGNRMIASELRSWLLHQRNQGRQFFVHLSVSVFSDLDDSQSVEPISTDDYRKRVERADAFVGQVTEALRETEVLGRTCVVLTAESGPHERCHAAVRQLGSLGEMRVSEEGLCNGDLLVPCIVRWPGTVAAGRTFDHTCVVQDLMPTFLGLAMARDRTVTDGVSLEACLKGRSQPTHPLIYWQSYRGGTTHQAAWKDGWKAFKAGGSRKVNLYRLSDDPGEQLDRAEEFPDVLAGLIKR